MNIINLGILAHIDAGKTSVTENLLFASGATEKCGRVDNGDTITDSMDIEKRRGITVRASTTSIIWNGVKCNIIDTPGHMDFIAEVERTFKMLDGAVLILSAKEGIQAQTKLLFSTLQKLQIPTIIFINKIDRAGVNLERLYMDIKTNLSQDVLQESTNALVNALYACPHGVFSMSYRMPGLVETSTNLAAVRFNEPNNILITTSQRSDVNSEKFNIANMVESVFTLAGAKIEHGEGYPGWAPNPDSPVVKVAVDSYKRLFGKEPIVRSIHAGLECGLFLEKYPNMDMVSFGPTLRGVHSPDEKINIKTVEMWWSHLVDILQNL